MVRFFTIFFEYSQLFSQRCPRISFAVSDGDFCIDLESFFSIFWKVYRTLYFFSFPAQKQNPPYFIPKTSNKCGFLQESNFQFGVFFCLLGAQAF